MTSKHFATLYAHLPPFFPFFITVLIYPITPQRVAFAVLRVAKALSNNEEITEVIEFLNGEGKDLFFKNEQSGKRLVVTVEMVADSVVEDFEIIKHIRQIHAIRRKFKTYQGIVRFALPAAKKHVRSICVEFNLVKTETTLDWIFRTSRCRQNCQRVWFVLQRTAATSNLRRFVHHELVFGKRRRLLSCTICAPYCFLEY